MHTKKRLDILMVERGLVSSREKAQALIMAGQVVVDNHCVDKSGRQIVENAEIRIKGEQLRYVSRGGLKLEKALDFFNINPTGLIAMDVGASTGGFTDCLLQNGALKVYAIDVGHNQLAWKLCQDSRVINLEKQNIRYLTSDLVPERVDLAVIDASFISLGKVLPSTIRFVKAGGRIVALIKPQFEVGKGEVGKGGIVRDAKARMRVIEEIGTMAEKMGLNVEGVCESPITGADGNHEFLMMLRTQEVATMDNCIFCKIIAGDIPAKKVYEDEKLIVIEDLAPQAPIHLLMIPKTHFSNCLDMSLEQSGVMGHLFTIAGVIAKEKGVDNSGFRLVQNNGAEAGQSVFHLHVHFLAGREFIWPPG